MGTGALAANEDVLQGAVSLPEQFDERLQRIIFDAETSGGLLVAVAPEKGEALLADLRSRGVIQAVEVGFVQQKADMLLQVV